jgi:DNA ligase-1
MLGVAVKDVSDLVFPLIATPKLDGIRALMVDGNLVSRKFKPIPNHHIRTTLEGMLPDGMDGEIMSGDTFQSVSSNVMSHDGEPDFIYNAFDYVEDLERPYDERLVDLESMISVVSNDIVQAVQTEFVGSVEELQMYEARVLAEGYEGVMLRHPRSPYKCGRSTVRQQYLLKLKQFSQSEAIVLGVEELMHNENTMEADELGYAKRSSAKDGKVPGGTLGAFVVRDIHSNVEFRIGTGRGLTAVLRQRIWDVQSSIIGQVVTYRYQPTGVKDAPRFPVWIGFRDMAIDG